MLIVNIYKTLRLSSSSIRPVKYFSTKTNGQQIIQSQNETKLSKKCHSTDHDKYNECIKNGVTPNVILANNWLYDIHIS